MGKEKIAEMFLNNKTTNETSKELKYNHNSICKIVKPIKQKRFTYKDFTEEDRQMIRDLYNSNNSTTYIGNQYGVSHHCIAKVLEEMKIPRDGKSRRKYNLDEEYFDNIASQNQAYILGFLYADGNNSPSKSTISLSLQEEDVDILEKMRNELKSSRPLEFIDYSNKHTFGYSYKNQYRLCLFSSHMCKTLEKLGMIQNKSLSLEFPKQLPQDLWRHFIRGYFDGDGSIYFRNKDKTSKCTMTITSTDSFCQEILHIFRQNLDGIGGNIYDASCHNGTTKVVTLSGNRQVKTVLDWLYKDSELFLQRKWERYKKLS